MFSQMLHVSLHGSLRVVTAGFYCATSPCCIRTVIICSDAASHFLNIYNFDVAVIPLQTFCSVGLGTTMGGRIEM